MKILIDMNLSPLWELVLEQAGYESVHWLKIGLATAPDTEIMSWAVENRYIVFTHDLDFSHLLAASQASSPSVIQVRGEDIMPEVLAPQVLRLLSQFKNELMDGALLSLDLHKARVRVLPLTE